MTAADIAAHQTCWLIIPMLCRAPQKPTSEAGKRVRSCLLDVLDSFN